MFFGLTNSPAMFQSMINSILRNLINEGHVVVYLDDILIFTETLEEHRQLVHQVLMVLRDHDLCLKLEKCFFEEPEVQYLGLIVGNGQVRTDPEKIAAVKQWKIPTSKKALQSFLRFVNFYRRFIRDFSKIAKPLHDLTGNKAWTWGPEQQTAFEGLKESLCA